MKILLLFTIFFLGKNLSGFAQDVKQTNLNCRLRVVRSQHKYFLGEPLSMELVLWPKQQLNLVDLLQHVKPKETFIDSFYIYKVDQIKKSENNVDAVVLKLKVVPVKPFDINILPFYSDGINSCAVEVKGFSFIPEKISPKLVILKQKAKQLSTPPRIWVYIVSILLIGVIVFLVGWWIYRFKQKKEQLQKKKMRQKYFITLIENASSRSDVERLYLLKDEWMNLLVPNFYPDGFFQAITPILYKKEWKAEELQQCLDTLKQLKDGLHG